MTAIHAMTSFFFGFISPLTLDVENGGLEVSEKESKMHLSLTTLNHALLFTRVPGMLLLVSI